MASHPYNLRNRVNSPASLRTPGTIPNSKALFIPLHKPVPSALGVQLDHVIGTTTKNPSGLSACSETNTFAYCAGSVAVLAHVGSNDQVTHRYYRARPAVIPINHSTSYYSTPVSTPTRKHPALITPRKEQDPTPVRALPEDENAKTWTARERIKSVKCVSISSSGKLLAVGETGYNPRVLLFSTARDAATEVPLSIITDHTWGVKSVAFSPDSCFLATLGESNDGFLFIWSVNQKTGSVKLCATNKCTTNVCHMTWCGNSLITVGTRHIKVWTLPGYEQASPSKRSRLRTLMEPSPSASPTPLRGRNCLLGDLVDATFTCVVAISERHAVVCADVGAFCLVDVSKGPAELTCIDQDSGPIGAMAFRSNPRRLVWAGGGGNMQELPVEAYLDTKATSPTVAPSKVICDSAGSRMPRRSALRQSLGISQLRQTGSVAVCSLTKHIICIDSESNLVLRSDTDPANQTSLASHNEPVQGVQALDPSAQLGAFYTWSKNGEVRFWNKTADLLRVEQIELEEGSDVDHAASNELKVLRYARQGIFLSGDRFGILKITRSNDWTLLHSARAHSAEFNDICCDDISSFVATCSRDRMVQVFTLQESSLDLLQTTDDHIAAVNQIIFNQDGNVLLSCSADRTIVVREKVSREVGRNILTAFLQTRIITIKASPLSMCLMPGNLGALYVSALDRHITKIDYSTGTILESFKVADQESDDHAVLNAIQVSTNLSIGNLRSVLIGCSSTDKSVRVYDLDKRVLLSKESAHTEGISDLAVLAPDRGQEVANRWKFVSTGLDSTIMVWTVVPNAQLNDTPVVELTQEQASLSYDSDNTSAKTTPAALPPLRKVLTKLDIAEFVKASSPRSPTLRDSSPARLKRRPSKLALAASAIAEGDENVSPALRRRASADDRAKLERRSPSPPPYATRRHKKPSNRGEVTKDFFSRQSEWLRKLPDPEDTPTTGLAKREPYAHKARLRRPPSVPTDLRARAKAQERRASTVTAPSDLGSVGMASEQICRTLRAYKKKLQLSNAKIDLQEIEEELESVLETVRLKRKTKSDDATEPKQKPSAATPRHRRAATPTAGSSRGVKATSSPGTSTTNSPTTSSHSGNPLQSPQLPNTNRITGADFSVDGISILLQKTNIAEA